MSMDDFFKYPRYFFAEFLGSLSLAAGQSVLRRSIYLSDSRVYTAQIGFFVFPFWVYGVMAMWYRLTGAHLNPIITVAWIIRKDRPIQMDRILAIFYIFAQYFGHFCGIALVWWYTTDPGELLICKNRGSWDYSDAIGQELVASFIYVLAYLQQTSRVTQLSKETGLQLLVISGTYGACMGFAFFRSGGSINPAFAFAMNFWREMKWEDSDSFRFIWIYTIIPFISAAFALLIHYLMMFYDEKNEENIDNFDNFDNIDNIDNNENKDNINESFERYVEETKEKMTQN